MGNCLSTPNPPDSDCGQGSPLLLTPRAPFADGSPLAEATEKKLSLLDEEERDLEKKIFGGDYVRPPPLDPHEEVRLYVELFGDLPPGTSHEDVESREMMSRRHPSGTLPPGTSRDHVVPRGTKPESVH